MKEIVLKKGRDKSVRNYHPWVFSGAIAKTDDRLSTGEIVKITDTTGEFLAYGYYNPASQISIRLLEWNESVHIDDSWWYEKILQAIIGRKYLKDDKNTNSYRLIYSECDGLPGLIIDKYADCLVLQSSTAGIDKVKHIIVKALVELVKPTCIYERSDIESRKLEGIDSCRGLLYGEMLSSKITILENGLKFSVDIASGQKTGFYIDQRENRHRVAQYADGKTVLDCFSNTGAFSIYALKAGAQSVTLIDSSAECKQIAEADFTANGLDIGRSEFIIANAAEALRDMRDRERKFDMVILDPPKFAKNQKHLKKALAGYKDINMLGMMMLNRGGYLASFSCSGLIDYETFKTILFWASTDTKRRVQLLHDLHQGPDHPRLATFPEGAYLKGFLCRVD